MRSRLAFRSGDECNVHVTVFIQNCDCTRLYFLNVFYVDLHQSSEFQSRDQSYSASASSLRRGLQITFNFFEVPPRVKSWPRDKGSNVTLNS